MSKSLSLFFAFSSIVLMSVTAILISHNGWLAALFGVLTLANVAFGFILKARIRKRSA